LAQAEAHHILFSKTNLLGPTLELVGRGLRDALIPHSLNANISENGRKDHATIHAVVELMNGKLVNPGSFYRGTARAISRAGPQGIGDGEGAVSLCQRKKIAKIRGKVVISEMQ
jgi:hypothetical protein